MLLAACDGGTPEDASTGSDCSTPPASEECIDTLVQQCSALSKADCAAHADGASCLWAIELTGDAMCIQGAGACVAVQYPGEGGPGPRWFDANDRVYDVQCDATACKDLVPTVYRMDPCDAVDMSPAACNCT
ncbi:MAG TPA: hypothetical protein VGB85_08710 [Nannocystis sp.]